MKSRKANEEKISAFLIVYNEDEIIERALKSVKGVVDEIIVIHDGPCKDNTLKIARKYTKKVFTPPRKRRAALHLIFAIKKAKNDWLLKIDADEFLSKELRKNIQRLAQNKEASAYTFKWLLWDGKKYVTRDWPRKKVMFRKSKASFLQFPGWDEPETKGKTIQSDYLLEHKPKKGKNDLFWSWKDYWKKAIHEGGRGRTQAEYTLKDFEELEKFQYDKKDFPLAIKIRRKYPLFSAPLFAILAFFKISFSGNAWKEGLFVFKGGIDTAIYYLWLGFYLHKLKQKKTK